jgi:hypothetical protein
LSFISESQASYLAFRDKINLIDANFSILPEKYFLLMDLTQLTVNQIVFDNHGTNRIKFLVKDPFFQHVIQRLEGDNWISLEGDMLDEYMQRLGKVIRKIFDI